MFPKVLMQKLIHKHKIVPSINNTVLFAVIMHTSCFNVTKEIPTYFTKNTKQNLDRKKRLKLPKHGLLLNNRPGDWLIFLLF